MIFGVGVDLVKIARIEAALARFGDRFPRRILTDFELQRFYKTKRKPEFLAKHFAAKEALVKALGTGFQLGVSWRHIEVRNNRLGRPYLECSARVQNLMDEWGVADSHVSLCDEAEYAAAFVTLTCKK